MIRPLSAEPPQDHKRIRERFDCDMLCRAAGALDHVANHETNEAAKLRTMRMADEIHAAAIWLRINGRDTSLDPEPAPGVDARTDDGRFIGGTGYGGERR